MKLKRRNILFLIFFILIIFFIIIVFKYLNTEDDKNPIYKMAYISKDDNLTFISEGINQASKDMNVEVEIYRITKENKIEEQNKLLEKCINDDIDAIIISPVDYEKILEAINKHNYSGPVILMDFKIDLKKKLSYISCNDYDIGKSLAEEIIQRGNTSENFVILENEEEFETLEEINKGFIEEVNNTKNKYKYVKISEDENKQYSEILKYIEANKVDVIVSFDSEILECIAKIKKDLYMENKRDNSDFEVYGVGLTNKILSYVEENIIDAVAVKNEFNLGYLSVKMAVNKLKNNKVKEKDIDFSIVNKRNMYSERNEKLLFPFVK
ncbi:substrate-binding domain-containing protein [Clostridium sardiniense]|uniref:Substrate-binding domain-containing protein n=1 Tax=Clostridium sardiniense TaxID=29369 RepID=A0ABS7KU68_CLOSR|nr:substrate-binding domain-containing protein [Clostridium sardiniense]MBY0754365.1 substrate-binding domain-containing protein [Clostridium sardiniense]MDQ0462026.1 ribose transport system substrate-binding protein [Clostridium sardiniense]